MGVSVEAKIRAQETRPMVTLYIINPYELRKEEKPCGKKNNLKNGHERKEKNAFQTNASVWRNHFLRKKRNVLK